MADNINSTNFVPASQPIEMTTFVDMDAPKQSTGVYKKADTNTITNNDNNDCDDDDHKYRHMCYYCSGWCACCFENENCGKGCLVGLGACGVCTLVVCSPILLFVICGAVVWGWSLSCWYCLLLLLLLLSSVR